MKLTMICIAQVLTLAMFTGSCITSSDDVTAADQAEEEQPVSASSSVTAPAAADALALKPEVFTCTLFVSPLRCSAGCCLLINNFTTPPTWSCNDCR